VLDIGAEDIKAEIGAHWFPQRSLGPIPPTDPLLYRLFEVRRCCALAAVGLFAHGAIMMQGVMVYGQPIKVGSFLLPCSYG
jgi:hypothetical protein